MTNRLPLVLIFCCLSLPLSAASQDAVAEGTGMISEEQALSLIRGQPPAASDSGLIVVHKIEPDSTAREIAAAALAEARSKHLELWENGSCVMR
jgi:hypothetical protein